MHARIFLLGRFAVEIDGREVPGDAWRRRRPVDLLVALALAQGRALHREQLIDRFWPDKSLEAGANNLHRALHDLRRVCGAELLSLDHGVVRLTPDAWVDVEEFEATAGGSDSELGRACELYRGDLLPDDPYSDNLAARRTALRQRFVDAALRLAAAHEQRAEPAARIEILRRALAIEPTLEPAHQGLMLALAQSGRQNEALRQFAECVTALHERLGSEPSAATRKLRQAIEAGEMVAPAAAEPPTFQVAPATQRLLRSDAPRAVYGRDQVLGAIARFAARPAGVLLIIGEAGLGKTRLAAECLRAHAHGAPALVGLGSDLGAAIPYAPFVDAWADLRARGTASPELDPFLELGPSSGSAQVDRLRLFRAVEAALRSLAGNRSVMLVIEDLHQADESTLYLFHHLARATRNAPLLLVGTLREEDIHVGQPLHTLVASLGREQIAERMVLERLEPPAVEQIARDVLGALDAEQCATIHELAEGNPFYAEELARSLAHAAQRPAIVKDLLENVRERVRRLGGGSERLLASAALVGSRFSFEIACAAAGLEREAGLDALERAISARVIDEDEGAYRFRHALLRKALSDQLTRARRIHLHAKIAEALASDSGSGRAEDAEALAFHYEAAGLLERALPELLKAAERAQRRLGLAEAASFLRRALDLMDAIDHADAAQHFRVLRNLGGLSLALADLEQAVRVLDAAAQIASDAWRPSRAELASVRKLAAMALIQGGQHEPAEQRLAEATALLDGEGSEELTGVLYLFAQLRWHQERFAESYELAARALAEARLTSDTRGMAKGHEMLALACHALGNWREGRQHELARAELGADTLDVDQAFDVHLCLWEYHLYGDSDTRGLGLREEVGRALAQATRMGAPRAEALCRCFGGTLDFLSGDWQRAEAELREAIQLFRRVGSACGEALSLQRAGVLATARGRLDEGRALLDEGIAAGVRAAMRSHCLTRLHASLARNRLAAGDLAGAQASIGAGLSEVARHGNCATCSSLLLPEAVRVSIALEQIAEAERYSEQLDAVAARFESRLWSAMAQQARGRVLAVRGARPAALEALAAAEASFGAAGYAYDAARCALLAARLARPSAQPVAQAEARLRALGSAVFED